MAESIEISTSKVNDLQAPNVSSSFDYDIPATIEDAQKRFPPTVEDGKLADSVYDMWLKGFTVALQAPARQELARQWESLPAERRLELMVKHEKDGVISYTAELPEAQRGLLQQYMNSWKLGERTPRVRMEYADPVDAFLAAAKDMTEERRAEVAVQVAAMLGLPTTRPRK